MVVDGLRIPPFTGQCQVGVGVGVGVSRPPHKKTPALGAGVSCSSSAQLGETAAELAGR